MPLLLTENFTVKLVDLLKNGEVDVAIMALPLPEAGLQLQPIYDEPFVIAVPRSHTWVKRKAIPSEDLKKETMLLLGTGHCFRDQVLEVCPELSRFSSSAEGIQKTFEGSSLETIQHMVGSGLGVTVLADDFGSRKTLARLAARLHSVQAARSGSPGRARVAQVVYSHSRGRGAAQRGAQVSAVRSGQAARRPRSGVVSEIAYHFLLVSRLALLLQLY